MGRLHPASQTRRALAALDLILTGKTLDARRAGASGSSTRRFPLRFSTSTRGRFAREKRGEGKPRRRRAPPLSEWALEATPLGRRIIFAKGPRARARGDGRALSGAARGARRDRRGLRQARRNRPRRRGAHIGRVFGGEVQKNLLALFFATEDVKKENRRRGPDDQPRAVTRVGVLGAGLMGGGIAQLAADRGLPARMKDVDAKALAHGFGAAASLWRRGSGSGGSTPRQMSAKMALLSGTLDYTGFARCEVTIEAVVEKLAVKRAVLKEWEARCRGRDLRVQYVHDPDRPDRGRGGGARARRRHALLQPGPPDAVSRGHPRAPDAPTKPSPRSSRSPRRSGRRRWSSRTRRDFSSIGSSRRISPRRCVWSARAARSRWWIGR